MKPGDELAQCFPNRVALSAHFPQECNGKDENAPPLLAQNAQNPARFLAETWQSWSRKTYSKANGGNTIPSIYITRA